MKVLKNDLGLEMLQFGLYKVARISCNEILQNLQLFFSFLDCAESSSSMHKIQLLRSDFLILELTRVILFNAFLSMQCYNDSVASIVWFGMNLHILLIILDISMLTLVS